MTRLLITVPPPIPVFPAMASRYISAGISIYLMQRSKVAGTISFGLGQPLNIHDHHIPLFFLLTFASYHEYAYQRLLTVYPLSTSDLLIERLTNSPSATDTKKL